MRPFISRPRALAVLLAGTALAFSPISGQANAKLPVDLPVNQADCFVPSADAAAKGGRGADTRDVSPAEQKAIEARTAQLLKAKAARGIAVPRGALAAANVPVYVHVMRNAAGGGDVTNAQIADQIAVLNKTFGGQESSPRRTPASPSRWPARSATTTTTGTRTSRAPPTASRPARAVPTR